MRNLRRLVCIGLIATLSTVTPALAWRHGAPSGVGKAQINLGNGDLTAQLFTNLFNAAPVAFTAGTNSPAAVDNNNFPVANFSGTISGTLGSIDPVLITAGPYTLGWDAGRSCFKINFLNAATITGAVNATVVNGAGSGNPSITGNCSQAGSVTITFNSAASASYQWDGTYTQWASNTTGRFYMARSTNVGWGGLSDVAAYNSGIYWTQEAVNFIKALKPESIRPMAWNVQLGGNVTTNVATWTYRRPTGAFSYTTSSDYPTGTRCGSAASGPQTFCTISVSGGALTAALATDTSTSGWVDNEQLTGNVASSVPSMAVSGVATNGGKCQFTVSTTANLVVSNPVLIEFVAGATECNGRSTILTIDSGTQFTTTTTKTNAYTSGGQVGYHTLTITGKTGGAKIVVDNCAQPVGTCFSLGSGNATFTYNATLDLVIYSPNGITNGVPIEAQVQLANLVNANFWYNIPARANDTFVTNAANTIYSNLNANLKGIFELDNELWNGGFANTHFGLEMGGALGITPQYSNSASSLPWQALRARQINGSVLPASSWAAAATRLDRLYCFQGGFGPGTGFATAQLQGSSLVSPGTAAYQTYVGGSAVNYNTSPNRPVDFTDSICYAPYLGGGTAMSGQSPDAGRTPTVYDAPLLNSIVSAWNSAPCSAGAGDCSASSSLIDQSVRGDVANRVQTVTASGTLFTTPLVHNYTVGDIIRFTVSGGTAYSNINLLTPYEVLTTSTAGCPGAVVCNFTVGQIINSVTSSAISAGSAGSGTMSSGDLGPYSGGSSTANQSIFPLMSTWYTKYQNMAVAGFSPSPAVAPRVRWYEGSPELTGPTTTQCTNISINSTDCATIATAIVGWKNSTYASATMAYYYQTFAGTAAGTITTSLMPNSSAPSQLVLQGGGTYALNSNSRYTTPAVYQTYYGFQLFSAN